MKHPSPFTVEKNVPIPRSNWTGNYRYPFRQMEIGDSFFVPGDSPGEAAIRVRSAASYFCHRNPGFYFSVLKVDGGCRVWRIESPRYKSRQ